jgi:hypothetical protein
MYLLSSKMAHIMNILTDMITQYENSDIRNIIELMTILYHANDINLLISKITEIPDLKKLWCFLGILYEIDGDIEEAIRCLKKSSKYELIDNVNEQYCATERLLCFYSGHINSRFKNIIEHKILLHKLNKNMNVLPGFGHYMNSRNIEDDTTIEALIQFKKLKKQHKKDTEEIQKLNLEKQDLLDQLQQKDEYILELEYMPSGIEYQKCKKHFEYLAKQ